MTITKTTMSIGDRMKGYENITRNYLIRRMPVIVRLDGKAFHTYTRKMMKPYDTRMVDVMARVSKFLLDEIQGAEIVYTQSDEISLFLRDYTRFESESWFDNNIQKMVSVSASMTTAKFNDEAQRIGMRSYDVNAPFPLAFFDARVFNIPKEDVINYFIWRQQDATRNSVQGLGQHELGDKKMHGLNNKQVQEELLKLPAAVDWNDCPDFFKYGQTFFKTGEQMPSPLYKENRDFLNEYIYIKEARE